MAGFEVITEGQRLERGLHSEKDEEAVCYSTA
jgi:hypothetical protein